MTRLSLTQTAAPAKPKAADATTVLLTSVAFFMVALDALVVMTALPSVHRSFGGSLGTLQWTVNAYTLTFAAGIVSAAALGDRLGRRRVYVAGLVLFTVASAGCALSPDLGLLIAARAIQGVGAAIVSPLSLTILTASFPPERRGSVTGMLSGVAGLAVAAGPLIGGAVTQGLSWHWVFWVNVPVGLLAAVGAALRLPESHGPRSRLDLGGLVLVSVTAAALVWGLVEGPEDGWGSLPVLVGLGGGLAALFGFVAWESRVPEPMVPLGFFRVRSFSAAVGAMFLLAASIYSAVFLTSQFFQFGFGYSPLTTGLRILPWTAAPLVVPYVAGALADRLGPRAMLVPGLLMQGGAFAWVVALAGSGADYAAYVPAFVVAGIGVSMSIPTASVAALNALPPSSLGKASAVLNTLRQLGAVAGIAVVTAVFSGSGSLSGPGAVSAGYRPGMAAAAGFSVLGATAAVAVGRARRPAARVLAAAPEAA